MAAEKGSAFLLKKGTIGSSTTVAGLRTTGLTLNGEAVDVTNKDSGGFRELLAGAGIVNASISGEGVFQDDVQAKAIRAAVLAKSLDDYVIEFENGDTISGKFQATSFEHSGDFNGELTYSLSLESSGTITITDNP